MLLWGNYETCVFLKTKVNNDISVWDKLIVLQRVWLYQNIGHRQKKKKRQINISALLWTKMGLPLKYMATHKGQQSCCRKLPVQLWEEVIKPQEQADEQSDDHESWAKMTLLTYFNLEPMLSECVCVHVFVQEGRDLQQVWWMIVIPLM